MATYIWFFVLFICIFNVHEPGPQFSICTVRRPLYQRYQCGPASHCHNINST